MREPSEAVQFACHLTRELKKMPPYHVAILADELMRLSRRHNKLQCDACNKQVPEGHDAKCEAKIQQLCYEAGIVAIFSGDPRGCTVRLKFKSGATNDMGREGICVPQ